MSKIARNVRKKLRNTRYMVLQPNQADYTDFDVDGLMADGMMISFLEHHMADLVAEMDEDIDISDIAQEERFNQSRHWMEDRLKIVRQAKYDFFNSAEVFKRIGMVNNMLNILSLEAHTGVPSQLVCCNSSTSKTTS